LEAEAKVAEHRVVLEEQREPPLQLHVVIAVGATEDAVDGVEAMVVISFAIRRAFTG